ncbi:MAG: hypothetical protein IJN82_03615 [Clostridia bacterium]|nr:hypothetical protein [Clostridia bacterium]
MSNVKLKKSELINGRLSILLFWCLLMGALIWAERNAWGRTTLIFRGMLPWLMPVIFGAFALAIILLAVLWKRGLARKEALFSTPFLIYLAAAPFTIAFLPWLAIFFPATQLFGFVLDALFVALIGYFISYILFAKFSPAAGLLAGFSTLCAAVLAGHHQIYIAVNNAYLMIDRYPAEALVAPIVAAVLLILLFTLQILAAKKGADLKKLALLIPFGITALLLLTSAYFRSLIPVAARGWLAFGGIIAIALWLIGRSVYDRIKK